MRGFAKAFYGEEWLYCRELFTEWECDGGGAIFCNKIGVLGNGKIECFAENFNNFVNKPVHFRIVGAAKAMWTRPRAICTFCDAVPEKYYVE